MMTAPFVCMQCGHRAEADGECPRCPDSPLLDVRKEDARELIRDHYRRRKGTREQWLLWAGVFVGITVIIALNLIPAYQRMRRMMALPLFIDQIAMMAALGYGVHVLLMRAFPPKNHFPELGS